LAQAELQLLVLLLPTEIKAWVLLFLPLPQSAVELVRLLQTTAATVVLVAAAADLVVLQPLAELEQAIKVLLAEILHQAVHLITDRLVAAVVLEQ
jgi:phosphoserine phosphatase